MLKPTKYLNLELSVISVSAEILKILRTNQLMKYDEVLSYLCETICDDVRYVFLPSINFLFLLGKLDYHVISDSLEYIETNEN